MKVDMLQTSRRVLLAVALSSPAIALGQGLQINSTPITVSGVPAAGGTFTGQVTLSGGAVASAAAPTTLTTSVAQPATGFILGFSATTGAVVGDAITGTNIAAGTYVSYVSGGSTVAVSNPVLIPSSSTQQFGVTDTTGIVPGMFITDSGGGLNSNAQVAQVFGTTSSNLVSPTATSPSTVIAVSSGGTSCALGSIVYDSTAPTALPYPNNTVVATTATTVTLALPVAATINNTDVVTCYPRIGYNNSTNTGNIAAADTLTFYPALSLSQATSGAVASATTVTLTHSSGSITGTNIANTGNVSTGLPGYQVNGSNFISFGASTSPVGTPLGSLRIGLLAGVNLAPTDSLTTAIGYRAFNFLNAPNSENTGVGWGVGRNLIDSSQDTLFGVNVLGTCTYGCHDDIGIGTDAYRNSTIMTNSVAIGGAAMLNANGTSNVGIGIGKVLQGSATPANNSINFMVAVGYGAAASTSMTTAQEDVAIGALAGAAIQTAVGDNLIGFEAGQSITTGGNINCMGLQACAAMTTGTAATAIGNKALTLATGSSNLAFGPNAGDKITSGGNNLCFGVQVCHTTLQSGSFNIIIASSSNGDTPLNTTSNYFGMFGNSATAFMSEAGTNSPAANAMVFAGYTTTTQVAVASLVACAAGTKGWQAIVTDASGPTFLGTVTGGGAVLAPVVCNATNWVTY